MDGVVRLVSSRTACGMTKERKVCNSEALYTRKQPITASGCYLLATTYSEDTWDVREGGEKPPLPRNCMRVCYCSAVKK